MAFNNVQPASGPFVLGPNGSTRVWIRFPNGRDNGATWIMADPIGIGSLTVSDFTKRKGVREREQVEVFYLATVTNNQPVPVLFTLQGGGNI
jgi:hypothetical protein